ncbi:MAG: dicarboxylate/amino acid:cation symporter [Treponema sp.]|nr:dicarboxylate/amino acid:cation symporter [Treponema sp.]
MKIWIKYFVGILLGIAFAMVLPNTSKGSGDILDFIVEMVIRFGRYPLVIFLFFSISTACYKLRDEKLMLKTGFWTFGIIVFSSALLVGIALVAATLIKLPRIPMTIESASAVPAIDFQGILRQLFPYTGIQSLLNDSYLLPCFIFAGLVGSGANDDKHAAAPAVAVFDSIARVAYIVMSFFTEILAVGMIALSCQWVIGFIALQKTGLYMHLFLFLLLLFVLTAFVLYPLLIRFLCGERHPYRVIYASIAPILAAFISGDANLTLPLLIRHGNESLGIRHRVNGVTYPLFSIFARGGAALVTSVCFIVILRSYSMLEIKMATIIWIGFYSFVFSFFLGEYPVGGTFLLLTILCIKHGGGYEAGYLLLREAAPILGCFAAAFDALTAMAGSYIVGAKTGSIERQELKKFI